VRYVTEDEVLSLHCFALEAFGGTPGIRSHAILEGALGAVRASFDGVALHSDPASVAAAYAFYLVRDHPFVAGNKRTALAVCDAALQLNGLEIPDKSEEEFRTHIERIAVGEIGRVELADWLRKTMRPLGRDGGQNPEEGG
jgi:death-on-curing protein